MRLVRYGLQYSCILRCPLTFPLFSFHNHAEYATTAELTKEVETKATIMTSILGSDLLPANPSIEPLTASKVTESVRTVFQSFAITSGASSIKELVKYAFSDLDLERHSTSFLFHRSNELSMMPSFINCDLEAVPSSTLPLAYSKGRGVGKPLLELLVGWPGKMGPLTDMEDLRTLIESKVEEAVVYLRSFPNDELNDILEEYEYVIERRCFKVQDVIRTGERGTNFFSLLEHIDAEYKDGTKGFPFTIRSKKVDVEMSITASSSQRETRSQKGRKRARTEEDVKPLSSEPFESAEFDF